jgi:integrase
MRGLIQKHQKYAYQAGIPADVRDQFGGRKKYQISFKTSERLEAGRLALQAAREFKIKVAEARERNFKGERIGPMQVTMFAGYAFGRIWQNVGDLSADISEQVQYILAEANDDQVPLARGIPSEGVLFDQVVQAVTIMYDATEKSNPSLIRRKHSKSGLTLIEAHAKWAPRAKHTQKTKDQYGADVREFTRWFEEKRGVRSGAVIKDHDVEQFTEYLMAKDKARATIKRTLAACKLVYLSGQFGKSNPFARVGERMIIHGRKLSVRRLLDTEVLAILRRRTDDNSRLAILIAAYSGMRLSEICALKWKHIERFGRTRVFNLTNAGRRKTEASYRKVPVHSVIWKELGKVKKPNPEEYLLPDEVEDKYKSRSTAISKRIARAINAVCPDPEAREHSFRHTFISKLAEAGVRKELRMAIVGHEGSDAHDEYTQADFLALLLGEVEKVQYSARK